MALLKLLALANLASICNARSNWKPENNAGKAEPCGYALLNRDGDGKTEWRRIMHADKPDVWYTKSYAVVPFSQARAQTHVDKSSKAHLFS